MKIYLQFSGEWKLIDSEKEKGFKKLLEERNIIISDSAEIGDSAKIGDSAEIGNYAKIGYYAKIGNYAEIGNSAEIGNYAKIGDSAKIPAKFNKIFSALNISFMVGVIMQGERGIFYKAVTPELKDFYTGEYQYKIGRGDELKLKRDQKIECGEGFHFTSYERAVVFADKRNHKIISAEIEMKDILSVHNKVRVKAYKNVKLVELN